MGTLFYKGQNFSGGTPISISSDISDNSQKIVATTYITNELNENKADKSIKKSYNLLATGWNGDIAPFTYSLAIEGATDTNVIEVLPTSDLSVEQYNAMSYASIVGASQSEVNITLKAFGEKPTIDLPIVIIIRGD